MLLERQTVVFCPNMGVLTAVVLALTPLVRPFAWQSMLLPVLPCSDEMLVFLDVRPPLCPLRLPACVPPRCLWLECKALYLIRPVPGCNYPGVAVISGMLLKRLLWRIRQ